MGLVPTRKSLELCDHLSASTFCRCVLWFSILILSVLWIVIFSSPVLTCADAACQCWWWGATWRRRWSWLWVWWSRATFEWALSSSPTRRCSLRGTACSLLDYPDCFASALPLALTGAHSGSVLSLSRNMEERVTWTDTSAIRKHVAEYNEEVEI